MTQPRRVPLPDRTPPPDPAVADYSLSFDATLVEEAVLQGMRALPQDRQAPFDREREAIYDVPDPDGREARFHELHQRWFRELGLVVPFYRALAERVSIVEGTDECRVFPAVSRTEEHADLLVSSEPRAGDVGRRALVVRIRAAMLVDPEEVLGFLRHELLHIHDMLDPGFGYERELPPTEFGPTFERLVRDRYRVLWDTTIDGRLSQAGCLSEVRAGMRHREFTRTFRMLGDGLDAAFRRWFGAARPRHEDLVHFAGKPRPAGEDAPEGWTGFCPTCNLPSAPPADRADPLSAGALREIRRTHPDWETGRAICTQCADVFEALAAPPR